MVKDVRVVNNYLVARRQRQMGSRVNGPWLGPYHVRDVAVNHWLSSTLGESDLAFVPQEVDLKKLGKKSPPTKSVSATMVVPAPIKKGPKQQQEIALSRREADPLAV